jgi:SecD/SecF fusion protein
MRFPIIKNAKIWVTLGLVWMVLCGFMFFSNLKLSKQFTGGIEFKVATTQTAEQVQEEIDKKFNDDNLTITTKTEGDHTNVLIQQQVEDEEKLIEHGKTIQNLYQGNMREFAIVGPSIGKQVSSTAVQAIIRGLILMAIFIVFEFSKIRKFIQPWVLALITVITMSFDILSPMGVYGLKMFLDATTQVDVIFVIALLTTMGYSITDTIVIFDRVREHLETDKNKKLDQVFEDSLWETMGRSLMTSGATLVVVLAMYFMGAGDLKNFAFCMIFGIISGSISSIFLAAPIAYLIIKKDKK